MNFSLLLKPVAAACNLQCTYCYYRGSGHPGPGAESSLPRMRDDVLEAVLRAYMQTKQAIYSMVWHGGEPTLLPCTFFKDAVALQKRYAPPGARIANSIQTNGTLITDELAAFMAHYRFLCGVSLDGPPHIHDRSRKSRSGKGTHAAVQKGIATLVRAGVPVNLLVLVSAANVRQPLEVYRYLKHRGATHIQFIPCVEWDDRGGLRDYAITGPQWGEFLIAVFEEWYCDDMGRVSIRLFESILAKLVHHTAIDCYNGAACNRYLVVERNGDVYPCDFFVVPAYKLGNLLENSFGEILSSEIFRSFSDRKSKWPVACETCEYLSLCMGDCLKFRLDGNGGPGRMSALCRGWKIFYGQTLEHFRGIAGRLMPTGTPNRDGRFSGVG